MQRRLGGRVASAASAACTSLEHMGIEFVSSRDPDGEAPEADSLPLTVVIELALKHCTCCFSL